MLLALSGALFLRGGRHLRRHPGAIMADRDLTKATAPATPSTAVPEAPPQVSGCIDVPCPLCAGLGRLQWPATPNPLISPREQQVLTLMAAGATREEIGTHLGITAHTVRNLQAAAYGRLGARNGTHAVAVALQAGLLDFRATAVAPSRRPARSAK